MDEDTVTIPMSVFNAMKSNERWIDALTAAGVDNWDGYDYAQEIFEEKA